MSFSSDVKTELCRAPIAKSCCAQAEAYGVLLFCNTFSPHAVKIVTGHPAFAERLPKLFRRAFSFDFDGPPEKSGAGRRIFRIGGKERIAEIYDAFGGDAKVSASHHVNLGVLEEECCRVSFVRGAFLAGGSVTDPSKRCHLELVTDHYSVSRETSSLLSEMGFEPKLVKRSGNYVLYFKQTEAIEDLFTTIGAPVASMNIMAAKVEKEMRNSINREVNCDTANADKVVAAAQAQLEAIRALDRAVGIKNLPDSLRETALLRIANPEASLSELAELSDPRVSKSCLSHRMKKLLNYSPEE